MAISLFGENEVVSRGGVNQRIQQINDTFPLPVSEGGTGVTSFNSGNILVGNGTSGITTTSVLSIEHGGTGSITKHGIRYTRNVMESIVLYNNKNGTKGNIDFQPKLDEHGIDNLNTFRYLEFYYSNKDNDTQSVMHDDGMCCSKVYRWDENGSTFNNTINLTISGGSTLNNVKYFTVKSARYNIGPDQTNKNKAIHNGSKSHIVQFDSNNSWGIDPQGVDKDIYVFRVVGYKI